MSRVWNEHGRAPLAAHGLLWVDAQACRLWSVSPPGWACEPQRLDDGGLRGALAHMPGRLWRSVDVVLGSRQAATMTVDLGDAPLPRKVVQTAVRTAARQRLAALAGDASAGRCMLYDTRQSSGMLIVFSCRKALMDDIAGAAKQAGVRIRSIRPAAAWGVQAASRQQAAGVRWIVVEEEDRLMAVFAEGHRLRHVSVLPPVQQPGGLPLALSLRSAAMRAGLSDATGEVWLVAGVRNGRAPGQAIERLDFANMVGGNTTCAEPSP